MTVVSDGSDANLNNGQAGTIALFSTEATDLADANAGWGLKITSWMDKSSAAITPGSSSTPVTDAYYSDPTTTGYNDIAITAKNVLKPGKLTVTITDTTVVNYGVKSAADQPAGTYQNTLTYTTAVDD